MQTGRPKGDRPDAVPRPGAGRSAVHGDAVHGDTVHGDAAHGDAGHGDAAHGDAGHGDAAHGDAGHGDAGHRDAAVALLVAAVVIGGTAASADGRWTDPSWAVVAAICVLPAWRRRRPVAVAWVTMLACGLYYPFSRLDGPVILAFVLALYTLAETGRTTAAAGLVGVSVAGAWLGETYSTSHPLGQVGVFMLSGWLLAVVAFGTAVHERSRRVAALEEQARHRIAEELTEERLRIARDVHDVVGHSLSVINVQAAAALHRLDDDPGLARPALENIKSTGKQALAELRGTLRTLRPADGALPVGPPPAAVPGLARLDDVVRAGAAAGTDVRVVRDGRPRPLPPDVDLAAYRVVQEALTNVRRHAPAGARAVVRIGYHDRSLTVQVDDDGGRDAGWAGDPPPSLDGSPAGEPPGGHGQGLVGLAERARVLGGELVAGPRPGGGYRVTARLPTAGTGERDRAGGTGGEAP